MFREEDIMQQMLREQHLQLQQQQQLAAAGTMRRPPFSPARVVSNQSPRLLQRTGYGMPESPRQFSHVYPSSQQEQMFLHQQQLHQEQQLLHQQQLQQQQQQQHHIQQQPQYSQMPPQSHVQAQMQQAAYQSEAEWFAVQPFKGKGAVPRGVSSVQNMDPVQGGGTVDGETMDASAADGGGGGDGGGGPVTGTNASPSTPLQPGQVLGRRMRAGLQQLMELRERRARLDQELAEALAQQEDTRRRSQQLDELAARERNALERAQQREAAKARELAAAREEAERLREFLQIQAQMQEHDVKSYSKEMTKIIENARVAPYKYEGENLKLVLEGLKVEQEELSSELKEVEKELIVLKDQYGSLVNRDLPSEICTEKEVSTILKMVVDDLEQNLEEEEEKEGELLEKQRKTLETQRESLTIEIKERRERPLRAMMSRASTLSSSSSSSSTSATHTSAGRHSKVRHQQLEIIRE